MHPLSLFISTNITLYFHYVQSMSWFRNTIQATNRLYRFISIADIDKYYYTDKKFNNSCLISFDDGDKTFYENAFPVLKEMNIPAIVFISPKKINNHDNYWFQEIEYLQKTLSDDLIKGSISEVLGLELAKIRKYSLLAILKNMKLDSILFAISFIKRKFKISINERFNITKDQLQEVVNSGLITIGAHTMNHPILSNEDDSKAEKEIEDSVAVLSDMIKRDVKYFAYPNGVTGLDYGKREQLILKKNNIQLAFTTDDGFLGKNSGHFAIPRVGFSKEKSIFILAKLILLPFWGYIRDIVKRRKKSNRVEAQERLELKNQIIYLNNL